MTGNGYVVKEAIGVILFLLFFKFLSSTFQPAPYAFYLNGNMGIVQIEERGILEFHIVLFNALWHDTFYLGFCFHTEKFEGRTALLFCTTKCYRLLFIKAFLLVTNT